MSPDLLELPLADQKAAPEVRVAPRPEPRAAARPGEQAFHGLLLAAPHGDLSGLGGFLDLLQD